MAQTMKAKRGFSLLEALIALAVASLFLGVAFDYQRQAMDAYRRAQSVEKRTNLRQDALELISDVQPGNTVSGRFELGQGTAALWQATPVSANTGQAGLGVFRVQLFRIDVRIVDAKGALLDRFAIERLGWTPLSLAVPGA